jgi:hypothetical protein
MTMAVRLDPTNEYVLSVLRRAKAKGVISYSALDSILDDKTELSCDEIEDIVALLADMGIQVIEGEEQDAAEREKAALHKSKQAAIEKYGVVLVHAAERWGRDRLSGVGSDVGIDPYESLIRLYRRARPVSRRRRRRSGRCCGPLSACTMQVRDRSWVPTCWKPAVTERVSIGLSRGSRASPARRDRQSGQMPHGEAGQ